MKINNQKNINLIRSQIEENLSVTNKLFLQMDKIHEIVDTIRSTFLRNNKLLICGNGGSASDAQHFAAELVVRYEKDRKGYNAHSLSNDNSIITATGNDYGFEKIFSRQIESISNKGDLLISISTSGESENIINATKTARMMGR